METSLIYRLCAALVRAVSLVVPRRDRADWRREWDAELRHFARRLDGREPPHGRRRLSLVHRALGSIADAAWLRRQFTHDAEVVHDTRHGLRLLRRQPAFAALAIAIIALGVGVTSAVFSVADTLLVRTLPYADADRVVMIWA